MRRKLIGTRPRDRFRARKALKAARYSELVQALNKIMKPERQCRCCRREIDLYNRHDGSRLGIRCCYCRHVFCLRCARKHFGSRPPSNMVARWSARASREFRIRRAKQLRFGRRRSRS